MLSCLCAVPSERRIVFDSDTQGCTLRWYALPLRSMITKMCILVRALRWATLGRTFGAGIHRPKGAHHASPRQRLGFTIRPSTQSPERAAQPSSEPVIPTRRRRQRNFTEVSSLEPALFSLSKSLSVSILSPVGCSFIFRLRLRCRSGLYLSRGDYIL